MSGIIIMGPYAAFVTFVLSLISPWLSAAFCVYMLWHMTTRFLMSGDEYRIRYFWLSGIPAICIGIAVTYLRWGHGFF